LNVDFIIGLDTTPPAAATTHLRSFEARIQSSERYYDSASSYLLVEVIPAAELTHHRLKKPGAILLSEEPLFGTESDSEEDLEDYSFEANQKRGNISDPLWDPETFSFSKDVSRRQHKSQAEAKRRAETHIPAPKLRTSNDVYNRLMWDTGAGDPNNFVIGYEDRFAGMKEIALASWKREISDREFVSGCHHCLW
jgi:MJ1316 RNA cyclic group end recognition domain